MRLLDDSQFGSRLHLVPFADAQRQIVAAVNPAYRVVAYRRFMVRVAEEIARRVGALALVTGESIGQVASQTVENVATIDAVARMPVLRPLIGMDKQEIINEARHIGSFDISILPDEDCCSLFVPRHPVLRSTAAEAERVEAALDVDGSGGDERRRGGDGDVREVMGGRQVLILIRPSSTIQSCSSRDSLSNLPKNRRPKFNTERSPWLLSQKTTMPLYNDGGNTLMSVKSVSSVTKARPSLRHTSAILPSGCPARP